MAAKRVLGAMGGWLAAAGLASGQAAPDGTVPPSPFMGQGIAPGGGALDLPPGPQGQGMVGYPGPGPQDAGFPANQLPPVPQAWMNSAFNPAPLLTVRTEALFWRSNQVNSPGLARQADIVSGGTFGVVDRGVDPGSRFFLTPRISVERSWPIGGHSLEVSGWGAVGPNTTETIGRPDFPLYLGGFAVGTVVTPAIVNNAPASFPLIADVASARIRQSAGDVELMWWKHCSPLKGAVADFAWGLGARYLWLNERLTARFEDQTTGSATPFGELHVHSQNDLYGPQFGLKSILQFPLRKFRIASDAKLALLNDDVRHTNQVLTSVAADGTNGRYVRSQLAFAFDGSLTAEFFLSQYVTFFAGYQVLYVDRVERATTQLSADFAAFIATKKNQDTLLYYGPKIGFMMVW